MPNQGDIVLIPIPFTDLSTQKRRPVIVISNDRYNQAAADVVVVAMTSTPPRGSFSFVIDSVDLTEGRLNRSGTVRVDRLFTLASQSSPNGSDEWELQCSKQFGRS